MADRWTPEEEEEGRTIVVCLGYHYHEFLEAATEASDGALRCALDLLPLQEGINGKPLDEESDRLRKEAIRVCQQLLKSRQASTPPTP